MNTNFILLFVTSASWGVGYLFVKIGEKSIAPIKEMAGRALIGAAALFVVNLLLKKDLRSIKPKCKSFLVFAILGVTIPWLGIAFSEEFISAGLTAAMASTMPLFTFLITAFIIKTERVTMYGLTGLLVALVGLIFVIGVGNLLEHGSTLKGVMIVLGAFSSYAINGVLVSKYADDVDPLVTTTYAIGFASILLVVLTLSFEKPTNIAVHIGDAMSVLGLGLISTALGFSGYYILLKRSGPFFASLLGYLAPVFGVLAGVVFLHERMSGLQVMGIGLVLVGVFLVNKSKIHISRQRKA